MMEIIRPFLMGVQVRASGSTNGLSSYPNCRSEYGGLDAVNRLEILLMKGSYLAKFFPATIAALPTAYAPSKVLQLPD
jgi:hypothetical protein